MRKTFFLSGLRAPFVFIAMALGWLFVSPTIHLAAPALLLPEKGGEERMNRKPELIGVPVRAVTYANTHPVVGPAPWGGEAFWTSYYCTTGAELIACDAATSRRHAVKLPAQGGYGMCVGKDGAIYVGGVGPGDLFRYDPTTGELRNCGGSAFGIQYLWDLAVAPDGRIYGAGYPAARLLCYDPATRQATDLGSMAPGDDYIRSICVDAKGRVWCGIGIHARLVVYDPATGEKREVLPARLHTESMISRLAAAGEFVCAGILFDGGVLLFDADELTLLRHLPPPEGEVAWAPYFAHEGTFTLGTTPSGHLYRLRPETGTTELLAPHLGQPAAITEAGLVHTIQDQDYLVYDLRARRVLHRMRPREGGEGMHIYTLTAGPDGKIYGSTYINQHFFRFDPATGALEDLGKAVRWDGQIDSLCTGRDGKIYLGSYVRAVFSIYDPSRPWRPGTDPDSNPREIGPLGQGQYRTTCQVQGPDGRVYVGSVPAYGSNTVGAMTAVDPKTGERRVMTDLVPGGAVRALAADDQWIYGAGGGRLFVFDPKTQRKVWEKELPVAALVVLPDRHILGATGDSLFRLDPITRQIQQGPSLPCGGLATLTVTRAGFIYGINDKAIVRVDPKTLTVTVLAEEGGQFLAAGPEGELYFARRENLYRFRP